ncbi:hypothetical protein AB6A40_009952 [Gnathostoma spinigerum]|uniref:Uncharacterized protein n=1 Tax=Gnathostoma spinigerum TaxID=75299 RepID=A0ABD6ETG3_9BILA
MEIVRDEEIDDDDDLEQVTKQLSEFKKSEARIILLYSTTNYARKIFQAANKVGMTSDNYLWIGTQSVKGSVIGNAHMQAGMLSINFHTVSNAMFPPDDDVLPLIIGLAPKVFGLALNKLMRAGNLFPLISNSSCDQPSSAKWPDGAVIYRKMKEVVMKGNPYHSKDGHDSFFYSFDHCGKLANSYLTISNLRRKKNRDFRGDNLIWEKHFEVGEFTNGELKMIDIEWPGDRAKPPQGTPENFHARVVTLQEPPFIIVSQLDPETGSCPGNQGSICNWDVEIYEDKGVTRNKTVKKCCSGFCIDLLQKLAKDIGFTYTIYKVPDNKWGRKTEKGWNGLMHELVSGKADMCVTALKLNSERAKDIDFSIPFMDTGISIIVKIRSGVLSPTAFLGNMWFSSAIRQ